MSAMCQNCTADEIKEDDATPNRSEVKLLEERPDDRTYLIGC